MTRVFNNSQCVHVWAQQTQAEGRNNRRSIYFEGPSIYSYGPHFEMGRFVAGKRTHTIVLLNDGSYSVTTSSHQWEVSKAVRHLKTFGVAHIGDHPRSLAASIEKYKRTVFSIIRARTACAMQVYLDRIEHVANVSIADYGREFPEAWTRENKKAWRSVERLEFLTEEERTKFANARVRLVELEERDRERTRRERLRRECAAKERREAEASEVEAWKAGAPMPYRHFDTTALRVRGDVVETTHGAEVPVRDARKLYRALLAGIDLGGRRVGHFTVQGVEEGASDVGPVLVAGCHRIPMSEIHRIGAMLLAQEEPCEA